MSSSAREPTERSASKPLRSAALALGIDLALVLLFAGIGRSTHERAATVLGLLDTAWPFIIGLGVSWLAARVARHPMAIIRAGLPIWVGSVVIGMLVRAATGAGTAVPFVIVATITLGVFLIGWRAIAALVMRLRTRTAA